MTNPNPVAPKTDTLAMQIPEQLSEHQARVSRDSTLGSHICACGYGYPGISYEEWMRHHVRELESTLAAERASRLQAEEALTGLWDVHRKLTAMRPSETTVGECLTAYGILLRRYRAMSKPTPVSPEQEKP